MNKVDASGCVVRQVLANALMLEASIVSTEDHLFSIDTAIVVSKYMLTSSSTEMRNLFLVLGKNHPAIAALTGLVGIAVFANEVTNYKSFKRDVKELPFALTLIMHATDVQLVTINHTITGGLFRLVSEEFIPTFSDRLNALKRIQSSDSKELNEINSRIATYDCALNEANNVLELLSKRLLDMENERRSDYQIRSEQITAAKLTLDMELEQLELRRQTGLIKKSDFDKLLSDLNTKKLHLSGGGVVNEVSKYVKNDLSSTETAEAYCGLFFARVSEDGRPEYSASANKAKSEYDWRVASAEKPTTFKPFFVFIAIFIAFIFLANINH